jgi:hypothetical protein
MDLRIFLSIGWNYLINKNASIQLEHLGIAAPKRQNHQKSCCKKSSQAHGRSTDEGCGGGEAPGVAARTLYAYVNGDGTLKEAGAKLLEGRGSAHLSRHSQILRLVMTTSPSGRTLRTSRMVTQ